MSTTTTQDYWVPPADDPTRYTITNGEQQGENVTSDQIRRYKAMMKNYRKVNPDTQYPLPNYPLDPPLSPTLASKQRHSKSPQSMSPHLSPTLSLKQRHSKSPPLSPTLSIRHRQINYPPLSPTLSIRHRQSKSPQSKSPPMSPKLEAKLRRSTVANSKSPPLSPSQQRHFTAPLSMSPRPFRKPSTVIIQNSEPNKGNVLTNESFWFDESWVQHVHSCDRSASIGSNINSNSASVTSSSAQTSRLLLHRLEEELLLSRQGKVEEAEEKDRKDVTLPKSRWLRISNWIKNGLGGVGGS
jgi:hypothetical protein